MAADEKLYYRDATSGEFREDKRKDGRIEYTLAKVNISIDTIEKNVETRFTMFETLLKEKLEYNSHQILEIKEDVEKSISGLIEKFKSTYIGHVTEQKRRDDQQDVILDKHEADITGLKKRVSTLETEPVRSKAGYFDKIVFAIVGLGSGVLIAQLKNILQLLLGGE